MSCNRGANQISQISRMSGLSGLSSRLANFQGLAWAKNQLKTGWGKIQTNLGKFVRGQSSRDSLDPQTLPELPPRQTARPLSGEARRGESCQTCGVDEEKPGPWYRLEGQVFCSDCAPDAAKQADLDLERPQAARLAFGGESGTGYGSIRAQRSSASTSTNSGLKAKISLKETETTIQIKHQGQERLLAIDQAYAVLRNDQPSGLVLTPALKIDKAGQLKTSEQWQVTHSDSGQSMGGRWPSLADAAELAGELSRLDWSRDPQTMAQKELAWAQQKIQNHRSRLETRQGGGA